MEPSAKIAANPEKCRIENGGSPKREVDIERIRDFLDRRARKLRNKREEPRFLILERAKLAIAEVFPGSGEEVYLIGSVARPFHFYSFSDVDIAVKKFPGDILEIQARLEILLDRDVDMIVYEKSRFKEHIDRYGVRVI